MQDLAENERKKHECSRTWMRSTQIGALAAGGVVAVKTWSIIAGIFTVVLTFFWLNVGIAFMMRSRDTGSHLDFCEAMWQGWLLAAVVEIVALRYLL